MSVPLLRSVYMIHIHVHTLAYQAILTVDTTLWPHSDIAAAKASLTAYRHVCASPQVSLYDTHPCTYSGLPSHSHSGHNSVASLGNSSSQGLLDCIQTCLCLSVGKVLLQVDPDKAKLIMDDSFSVSLGSSGRVVIEPQRPVSCWREGSLHLCVAPVLVCKDFCACFHSDRIFMMGKVGDSGAASCSDHMSDTGLYKSVMSPWRKASSVPTSVESTEVLPRVQTNNIF
ncbi:hypothetical protein J6590_099169 [Homalodisca vitripennis]|nr:hypothetical protein J6590_099169 [Homalodisca vitripennis]